MFAFVFGTASDGRRVAPGWLRRQPHHAGIDHTRRVSAFFTALLAVYFLG
jgi:hypothetical protein